MSASVHGVVIPHQRPGEMIGCFKPLPVGLLISDKAVSGVLGQGEFALLHCLSNGCSVLGEVVRGAVAALAIAVFQQGNFIPAKLLDCLS